MLQAEEQNQQPTSAPEIPSRADSKESSESKPKRGGKRPGAGRKPNLAKHLRMMRCLLAFSRQILSFGLRARTESPCLCDRGVSGLRWRRRTDSHQ